jgi:hypothetical protein
MTTLKLPLMQNRHALWSLLALVVLTAAGSAAAIDMSNLAAIGGPLATTFTLLSGLTPGIKALVAFLGFIVTAISLIALRSFGNVIFFIGLIIFLAVGLTVAGAMLGAVV